MHVNQLIPCLLEVDAWPARVLLQRQSAIANKAGVEASFFFSVSAAYVHISTFSWFTASSFGEEVGVQVDGVVRDGFDAVSDEVLVLHNLILCVQDLGGVDNMGCMCLTTMISFVGHWDLCANVLSCDIRNSRCELWLVACARVWTE